MNVTLSIDLVVPEERLFLLSLAELKTLEQRLFEQSQRECYALSQLGAVYLINFKRTETNGRRAPSIRGVTSAIPTLV